MIIEHDISVLAAPKPNTDTDMNNNTTSQVMWNKKIANSVTPFNNVFTCYVYHDLALSSLYVVERNHANRIVRTDEQQERPVVIGTITVVKTDDPIKTEPQDPDYDEARQRSTDGSSTQACAKCKRLKRKLNDKQDELEVN